ncbi:transposase [Candidatus Defluviicoccus seviourii]|uniref:Transposase n=1 Tax=Candidatus Defluviicoccus seviourii TaxID=2565273 RepID=A0A564WHF6_9PROT|nr:transposase [Candidatus Defluviicoccus seviourii]
MSWYSAAELAGLPGLPAARFPVAKKATREGWQSRERAGAGAGVEYHITSLPESAIAALRRQNNHSQTQEQSVITSAQPVEPQALTTAAVRAGILELYNSFAQSDCEANPTAGGASPAGQLGTTARFCARYNTDSLPTGVVPALIRAVVPSLSARTVWRWRREGARLASLRRHGGKRTPSATDDPDIDTYIKGCIAGLPHIDCGQIFKGLKARFTDGRPLPSLRALQRYVARYRSENAAQLLAVANPDAYRSRHQPAFGDAAAGIAGLNAQWQADATIGDLEIITPDGRRWAIISIVDVWSRRGLLHLTPTVSGAAYGAAYRKALLKWGVPDEIVTDHGSAETSAYVTALLGDLKIRPRACRPHHPEDKGFIESFLGTASHQYIELLPGYVGHNVADRQAIRARKGWGERFGAGPRLVEATLTAEELQAGLDAWCEAVYGRQIHSGIGTTPELKAASWTRPIRQIADVRALDMLLMPLAGVRVVRKKGLRIQGGWFIAPELAPLMGEELLVRTDPVDMGRVYVFRQRPVEFICEAVCADRLGADRRLVAIEAKRRHAAHLAQVRSTSRALAKRAKPERIAEEVVAAGRAANVVVIPSRGPSTAQTHTTPAMIEAARAARAQDAVPPPALTVAQQRILERLTTEPVAAPASPADEMAAKKARFARAKALEARLATNDLTEPDARWLKGYQRTPEYRALAAMEEDFGAAACA